MKTTKKKIETDPALELSTDSFLPSIKYRHIYNKHVICVTDTKGHAQPEGRSVIEIRVDATDGFIPLWEKNVTLNWRFNKSFGSFFKKPEAAKGAVRKLFGEAIMGWKEACPIRFREVKDGWDFEIAMHKEDCDNSGCVLAA